MLISFAHGSKGLHLRSGVARENLSELHGNIYLETCKTCKHNYLRDFDAAQVRCEWIHAVGHLLYFVNLALASYKDADDNHYTGRDCEQPSCQGKLIDSIIGTLHVLPQLSCIGLTVRYWPSKHRFWRGFTWTGPSPSGGTRVKIRFGARSWLVSHCHACINAPEENLEKWR